MKSPVTIPQGAVTWSITDVKNAVRLGSANEDGVHAHEWPIDELTTENVKRHWNHGTFRVTFFGKRKSGARFPKGNEVFTIEPQRAAPQLAAAPVAPQPMFDPMAGIDPNLRMMMMFRQQAKDEAKESQNSTLQLLAGLGQVMKGLRGEGPGAETIALTNAVNQIAGVVNALAAKVARIEDEDEEGEDGDGGAESGSDGGGLKVMNEDGAFNTPGLVNGIVSAVAPAAGAALVGWLNADANVKQANAQETMHRIGVKPADTIPPPPPAVAAQ